MMPTTPKKRPLIGPGSPNPENKAPERHSPELQVLEKLVKKVVGKPKSEQAKQEGKAGKGKGK